MWWEVGVARQGRRAGLFGDYRFEWNRNLFLGRGQRDVCLVVQVVSERSDLLSVPAVHPLHHRSPVVLASFVKRAVWSQAQKSLTKTREPESEEEEDHGQDEEEDDKQGDSDWI